TTGLVLEETDDLQIGRLHVWADHFDRKRDPKGFDREDAFLWRGTRVGSRSVHDKPGANETQEVKFVFHIKKRSTKKRKLTEQIRFLIRPLTCFEMSISDF